LNRIDISLDPFPFNGITTTRESLWMGLPVVSLAGQTSGSRAGPSILHAAQRGDWAASSPEAYVERAVSVARELESLGRYRRELRGRMRQSPLLNGTGFARRLQDAFGRMRQSPLLNGTGFARRLQDAFARMVQRGAMSGM